MDLNFTDQTVLVVGDIILDRYFIGGSDRISPEAPIPVVTIKTTKDKLGGAANVAHNIKALGANVRLLGIVGDDTYATLLGDLLTSSGIDYDFQVEANYHTITKARVLSRNQQMLRLDFENLFTKVDKAPLFQSFKQHVAAADIIIFSDYLKGTLSNIESMIEYCRARGKKVVVDPKGLAFERYLGATVLTPNLKEFEAIMGSCRTTEMLAEKASLLVAKLGLDALLVTQGDKGMTLFTKQGESHHFSTHSPEVVDVTGAGDTVVATLSLAMAKGYSWQDSSYIANEGAGVVVQHLGTAALSISELEVALGRKSLSSHLLSAAEIKDLMILERDRGKQIVMTNGCFDILHAGHVAYLEKAKTLGDRLVVAVNDDDSVKRLKGHGRPYLPLSSRLKILSALSCVDWVVSFSEDTPINILTLLQPDILVKGPDYTPEEVVGHEVVLKHGGRVEIISHDHLDISTTKIINKIKKTEGTSFGQ